MPFERGADLHPGRISGDLDEVYHRGGVVGRGHGLLLSFQSLGVAIGCDRLARKRRVRLELRTSLQQFIRVADEGLDDYLRRLDEGDIAEGGTGSGASARDLADKIATIRKTRDRYWSLLAVLDRTVFLGLGRAKGGIEKQKGGAFNAPAVIALAAVAPPARNHILSYFSGRFPLRLSAPQWPWDDRLATSAIHRDRTVPRNDHQA
jgi:hypothetical protein